VRKQTSNLITITQLTMQHHQIAQPVQW